MLSGTDFFHPISSHGLLRFRYSFALTQLKRQTGDEDRTSKSLTCRINILGFACSAALGTVGGVFSPLSFVLNFNMDQLF